MIWNVYYLDIYIVFLFFIYIYVLIIDIYIIYLNILIKFMYFWKVGYEGIIYFSLK